MDGPINRAELNMAELVAMALGSRLRLETRSSTKFCLNGASMPSTMPCQSASTISGHQRSSLMKPLSTPAANRLACTMNSDCVSTSVLRRSQRSAQAPAKGLTNSDGIMLRKPIRPSKKAEFVSR
ncbi:MAG: hypothetical protein BWX83_01028 [Candidatus Cloacimonetes bacterium ADurb.Bin117]|nr:MAG: hypothetical protein BWX83_01028 [Candidatus Cloacimonetes bacterium ADurb.Bin117]